MRLVIALVLVVAGIVGGGALGAILRPAPPAPEAGAEIPGGGDAPQAAEAAPPSLEDPAGTVKLARQLIVPVVDGGVTRALMLFDVALDVPAGQQEAVFEREPRLRDAFLRELFEMSYSGMFEDTYTSDRVMDELRERLLAAARVQLGGQVNAVLILDALRQETVARRP